MKKFLLLFALIAGMGIMEARQAVLIHGFALSSHHMVPIGKKLRACGYDVCLWDYPSRKFTFQCHAEHLVEYLQQIACRCPGEPIDFVTHSVGSVVLSIALSMPGCPEEARVGRAVLLAPTNRGSSLARRYAGNCLVEAALGPHAGRQLMYCCPEHFEAMGCFPEGMPILVLAGKRGNQLLFNCPNDGYLLVDETYISSAHTREVLFMTHGNLLTCCEAHNKIRDFLLCKN